MRTKIQGLRELERDLRALGKHTTARSVARRVLKAAGRPVADTIARLAPDDPSTSGDDLKASITVSTRLNKRQRRKARKDPGRSTVEVYVGTNDPAGVQQEFGNIIHPPQSFMRPGWSTSRHQALSDITSSLKDEIKKTARRLQKRAAKKR